MKKLATFFFIILVLLPMLLYLNPFIWGMREKKKYRPSSKTISLIQNLNKKYNTDINIEDGPDTLWYFRDLKTKKIQKLENLTLGVYGKPVGNDTLQMFIDDFKGKFTHRKYFDSIIVQNDSLTYKAPLR